VALTPKAKGILSFVAMLLLYYLRCRLSRMKATLEDRPQSVLQMEEREVEEHTPRGPKLSGAIKRHEDRKKRIAANLAKNR
jgi:hypothetical protein